MGLIPEDDFSIKIGAAWSRANGTNFVPICTFLLTLFFNLTVFLIKLPVAVRKHIHPLSAFMILIQIIALMAISLK